jgi:hypothetical protein
MFIKKKPKIIWPKKDKQDKIIEDGSIDGIPFITVLKECDQWSKDYCKRKCSKYAATEKVEKAEIKELWAKMDKNTKEYLENTKVIG